MAERRSPRRGVAALAVAGVLAGGGLLGLTACSAAPAEDATAVVASLGAVPVPSPEPDQPTPTAGPEQLQVLAMGAQVHAVTAGGSEADVTALGPDQVVSVPDGKAPPTSTPATMTLRVHATAGVTDIAASELSSRDETGTDIPFTAVGPATLHLEQGQTGTLVVRGTYRSGSAQLTWTHDGAPLAVWDFTIELD